MAEVMRQVRELLLTELGVVSRLPLATTVPRVSKAGDALLKPDGAWPTGSPCVCCSPQTQCMCRI